MTAKSFYLRPQCHRVRVSTEHLLAAVSGDKGNTGDGGDDELAKPIELENDSFDEERIKW